MLEVRMRKFEAVRSEGQGLLTSVVDYGSGEHHNPTAGNLSMVDSWGERGCRYQCVLRFLESLEPTQIVAITEGETSDGKVLTFVYYRVGSY